MSMQEEKRWVERCSASFSSSLKELKRRNMKSGRTNFRFFWWQLFRKRLSNLITCPLLSGKRNKLGGIPLAIISRLQPTRDAPQPMNIEGALQRYTLSTAIGPLTVRQAGQNELEEVVAILVEAAQWVTSQGYKQWSADHFLHPTQWAFLHQKAKRGELYVAQYNSDMIGTIILQEPDKIDRGFWREEQTEALYVHRLAIRRAFAGKRIGYALLAWAQERATLAGKKYLRLDCQATNPTLCAYYERVGFTCRGTVGLRCKARLYELPVH
jgi:GNAT superfamily N-acetyltransferase